MADTTSHAKSHSFQRSLSPSGRFSSSSISSSSSAFASQSPSLYSRSPSIFHRPSSPTRVNIAGFASRTSTSSSSVRFSIDRPTSPGRSFSVNQVVRKQIGGYNYHQHHHHLPPKHRKKTCMCSPTTHPGSFRCSLHKATPKRQQTASYQPHRLNMRRSAMTNSLVRIGTVEGEWVKRSLATLIRPSSHNQRRRADFQPKPSRLSIMSKAEDL